MNKHVHLGLSISLIVGSITGATLLGAESASAQFRSTTSSKTSGKPGTRTGAHLGTRKPYHADRRYFPLPHDPALRTKVEERIVGELIGWRRFTEVPLPQVLEALSYPGGGDSSPVYAVEGFLDDGYVSFTARRSKGRPVLDQHLPDGTIETRPIAALAAERDRSERPDQPGPVQLRLYAKRYSRGIEPGSFDDQEVRGLRNAVGDLLRSFQLQERGYRQNSSLGIDTLLRRHSKVGTEGFLIGTREDGHLEKWEIKTEFDYSNWVGRYPKERLRITMVARSRQPRLTESGFLPALYPLPSAQRKSRSVGKLDYEFPHLGAIHFKVTREPTAVGLTYD